VQKAARIAELTSRIFENVLIAFEVSPRLEPLRQRHIAGLVAAGAVKNQLRWNLQKDSDASEAARSHAHRGVDGMYVVPLRDTDCLICRANAAAEQPAGSAQT